MARIDAISTKLKILGSAVLQLYRKSLLGDSAEDWVTYCCSHQMLFLTGSAQVCSSGSDKHMEI